MDISTGSAVSEETVAHEAFAAMEHVRDGDWDRFVHELFLACRDRVKIVNADLVDEFKVPRVGATNLIREQIAQEIDVRRQVLLDDLDQPFAPKGLREVIDGFTLAARIVRNGDR